MTLIPTLNIDSSMVPAGQAFQAYQQTLPYYRLSLGPDVTPENFQFAATAWLLDGLVLSRTKASAGSVSRTEDHIRSDGNDHFAFLAFTSGSWVGEFGGRPVTAGAGQIVGFDLSKPFEVRCTDQSTLSLSVARSSFSKQFGDIPDLHGHLFEGICAEMLLNHMVCLHRHVSEMLQRDISTVAKATLEVVAAAVATIPKRTDIEPSILTFQHDIRRFIEDHLHDFDLTPDRIARDLSISRSTLFRAFRPLGGVAAYVQHRRLEVIRGLLLHPAETRSINDLAHTFGFVNQSHFAVAFKKAFGRSARQVRNLVTGQAAGSQKIEGLQVSNAYPKWRRRLVLR